MADEAEAKIGPRRIPTPVKRKKGALKEKKGKNGYRTKRLKNIRRLDRIVESTMCSAWSPKRSPVHPFLGGQEKRHFLKGGKRKNNL